MKKTDVLMRYSGATDITGRALVEALGITGTREPFDKTSKPKIFIGWGAKTTKDVTLPENLKVLNHPNAIRNNRNKYNSLVAMQGKKVLVADFCTADEVKANLANKKSPITLPLVARTNFHQGGKGFWTCLTASQVDVAISEGAQYFQNYMDIEDEYRLHLLRGKLLYAQKKKRRENMEEAFVDQQAEKIKSLAGKNDVALDEATLNYVLGRVAKGQEHADMIIRSNSRGWRFSNVALKNVKKELLEVSVASLETVGLDFGAVDCCITTDGKAYIIEINSGPGLKETPFKVWTDAFASYIKDTLAGKAPADVKANLLKSVRDFAGGFEVMVNNAESEEEVKVLQSLWERSAGRNQ